MTHVRPAEVSETFRRRVADALTPRGFVVRAKGARLDRRQGTRVHRIQFSSSFRNEPGYVVCWPALIYQDKAIPGAWQAGGGLLVEPFADELGTNVADPSEADALFAHLLGRVAFFDLLDDAPRFLEAACSGYVPGLHWPSGVVPYLRARLGPEAVSRYAGALLRGRPELWPAFLSAAADPPATAVNLRLADDGTSLATALESSEREALPAPPADATTSRDVRARHQRSFLGLLLRAWGEPEAAARLRAVGDDPIVSVSGQGAVDRPERAREALRLATGEERPLRRDVPSPRYCQYKARHGPFAGDSP